MQKNKQKNKSRRRIILHFWNKLRIALLVDSNSVQRQWKLTTTQLPPCHPSSLLRDARMMPQITMMTLPLKLFHAVILMKLDTDNWKARKKFRMVMRTLDSQ